MSESQQFRRQLKKMVAVLTLVIIAAALFTTLIWYRGQDPTQAMLRRTNAATTPEISEGIDLASIESVKFPISEQPNRHLTKRDLMHLNNLSELKTLTISLDHIDQIERLPKSLKTLTLSGPKLDNVEFLNSCDKLEHLVLTDVGTVDFEPLGKLSNLKNLTFVGCKIRDFKFLTDLKNLELLAVVDCQLLGSFEGIEQASSITAIRIEECKNLEELSYIGKLQSLSTLVLTDCSIGSLEFVRQLDSLQTVIIHGTQIETLRPLSLQHNLMKLVARGPEIRDLGGIRNLENLQIVDIEGTSISSVDELSNLQSLKILNLRNSHVSDLEPLSKMKSLHILDISGTRVTSLKSLEQTKLITITLDKSQLSDMELEDFRNMHPDTGVAFRASRQ